MLPEDLVERAARRHGLLTWHELEDQIGAGAIRYRVARRSLVRLQRTVYAIAGTPRTWRQRLLAAVLAAGEGAVASMRGAAALYGLEEYEPETIEVTLPRGRRAALRGRQVVVHDSNRMPSRHTTVVDAIPTTTVARTLCDLTAVRPTWGVERVVDTALMRRLTTREHIERTFVELAGRGRRRCTIMREILEARDPATEAAESPRERRVAQLLVDAGLPRPVPQHTVHLGGHVHRLDLAYPQHRIAIEYDGWDAHATRSAFDADRARQNRLSLDGWRFLRFTSAASDEMVVRDVANALELVSVTRDMCA